jgi:hypothetical protein
VAPTVMHDVEDSTELARVVLGAAAAVP